MEVYTSSKYSDDRLTPLVLTSPWSVVKCKNNNIKLLEEEFNCGGNDEITAGAAITVKVEDVRQEILGFGGAITDAVALTYYSLPHDERNRLIDTYFGDKGGR